MLLGEVVDQDGTPDDFVANSGGQNFVIITSEACAPVIRQTLQSRFAEEILIHYNFLDRQQGYIQANSDDGAAEKHPFMTLAVGIVSPNDFMFADIREITEQAAEARRKDIARSNSSSDKHTNQG